jgi:DNA-binding transcriptional MocR family regulator
MTEPINADVARIGPAALADLLGHWPAGDGPLYRLLAARIGRLADTAQLPVGLRLPPERELASALSVSRNTVAMAYQQLRDEGMADSRRGSGTWIAPHRTTPAGAHRANGAFTRLLESATLTADLTRADVECAPQVAAALADPAAVLTASQQREATSGPGYYPAGLPGLRAAIACLLAGQGLPTRAEEVIVTTGAQQALDLLVRCGLAPGQAAVVEDPTFPGMLDALQGAGIRPVGMRPGDAGQLAHVMATHRPGLAYLIPDHHNPSGLNMELGARQQVVALARAHPDTVFVDDQTLRDLPLSAAAPQPPLAALGMGLPNLVTVGSLSKTYWGGLRTGWIRAGEGAIARLAAAKAARDLGSPVHHQAVAAGLISLHNETIHSFRVTWLRPRYDALAAAMAEHLPQWRWTRPDGGLSIWAQLPGANGDSADAVALGARIASARIGRGQGDTTAFAQAALRRGVAVVPGRLLSPSARDSGGHIRLVFTQPPDVLTGAVKILAEVAAERGHL